MLGAALSTGPTSVNSLSTSDNSMSTWNGSSPDVPADVAADADALAADAVALAASAVTLAADAVAITTDPGAFHRSADAVPAVAGIRGKNGATKISAGCGGRAAPFLNASSGADAPWPGIESSSGADRGSTPAAMMESPGAGVRLSEKAKPGVACCCCPMADSTTRLLKISAKVANTCAF